MSEANVSILISSHNRLNLFRRTLYSIATNPPIAAFEVVVCDDGSSEDILGELRCFSSRFAWTFIRFDAKQFEGLTGLKKAFNNPAVTNNIAYKRSAGQYLFQQGNEVLATPGCYDQMLADAPKTDAFLVMSTTYDVPPQVLEKLDKYGSNLTPDVARECEPWPLQSIHYRSDVTNYISLAPRLLWETLGGYDERYFQGISAEDSDFVRRARQVPGFQQVISEAVSLHQSHGGKTCYYNPPPWLITQERWKEGVSLNRAIYDSWDGTCKNPQKWPFGEIGIVDVIRSRE